MSDIQIKVLSKKINKNIAVSVHKVHINSLPNDVMPNFGMDLEYRYLQTLLSNNGKLLTANNKNKFVGFITLRTNSQSLISELDFKSISLFLISSLQKPLLLIKLFKQLFNRTKQPKLSAEIDYFAVDEDLRGKGIGSLLIAKAEEIAVEEGLSILYTKTSNEGLYQHYLINKSAQLMKEFEILGEKYRIVCWKIGGQ